MARYNQWANLRLYDAAGELTEDALRRDVGVYFKSLYLTLEHLLRTDWAWTHLLRGHSLADMPVMVPPADFAALRFAREAQDAMIVEWLDAVDEDWLERPFSFTSALGSWRGMTFEGSHASTLAHVFNHQTHHRGQAHSALSLLGVADPPALDILVQGMLGE
ncbi:DinB family protein [Sphingobium aromaticivastans]|uniref:DinB family protein n=1 Tax=Sphingobium aromaticivastans TaxID=1778665 RepID=UPI0030180C55